MRCSRCSHNNAKLAPIPQIEGLPREARAGGELGVRHILLMSVFLVALILVVATILFACCVAVLMVQLAARQLAESSAPPRLHLILNRFWRTFGAGAVRLVRYLEVVSQPMDVVRSSLPNPDLLELEGTK